MLAKKKIIWVCGPQQYHNEGVGKYSLEYITALRKIGYDIQELRIPYPAKSFMRIVYQFLILPCKLMFTRNQIIFYEEFYSVLLWILWFKRPIIIVHHLDKDLLKRENTGLLGKLFIYIYLSSLWLLNHTKKIITISENSKKQLLAIGVHEDKIIIIPNSIDEHNLHPFVGSGQEKLKMKKTFFQQHNIPESALEMKVICHISVFHPRKNLLTLLKSLTLLQKDNIPYLCLKVGSILDEKEYKENMMYIKKHRLNVIILNALNDIQIINLLQISDIFIFPSLFEGFGRPPIEAQACGCPVISTHGGALGEVVGESCIQLKDYFDDKELENHIVELMTNKQLRDNIIEKGFINIQRFTTSANTSRFQKII